MREIAIAGVTQLSVRFSWNGKRGLVGTLFPNEVAGFEASTGLHFEAYDKYMVAENTYGDIVNLKQFMDLLPRGAEVLLVRPKAFLKGHTIGVPYISRSMKINGEDESTVALEVKGQWEGKREAIMSGSTAFASWSFRKIEEVSGRHGHFLGEGCYMKYLAEENRFLNKYYTRAGSDIKWSKWAVAMALKLGHTLKYLEVDAKEKGMMAPSEWAHHAEDVASGMESQAKTKSAEERLARAAKLCTVPPGAKDVKFFHRRGERLRWEFVMA